MSDIGDEFESLVHMIPKEQWDKLPSVKSMHNNGWIKCTDQEPPPSQGLLVVKQYQDAPFEDGGYNWHKSFWNKPMIQLDSHYNGSWGQGGRVTHWMAIPKLPKE